MKRLLICLFFITCSVSGSTNSESRLTFLVDKVDESEHGCFEAVEKIRLELPQNKSDSVYRVAKGVFWDHIFLRTNLLYWFGGILNVGAEWKPTEKIGIVLDGGWAPWSSDRYSYNWSLRFIAPSVRYYLDDAGQWSIGVQFLASVFNFKTGEEGSQGRILAGGIIGSYKLSLGHSFLLDFSLGLGYGNLKYDTYRRSEGANFYTGRNITKNAFMPIEAGVSLIWIIQ